MNRQAAFEERMRLADAKRQAKRGARANRKPVVANRSAGVDVAAREAWYRRPFTQMCEVCGENPATEAHHAVREQLLRSFAGTYGFDYQVARWDVGNRVWICSACHEPHSNASKRIALSALPTAVFDFAEEHGMLWVLDQDYAA